MVKRGQTTVFIIAGILIIALFALFFTFREDIVPNLPWTGEQNPSSFLKTCLEDNVREGIELISSQGGYVESSFYKNFKFEDENEFSKISYLCYNQNYYLPCINQEPLLIKNLKDETKKYLLNDVARCFDELGKSLDKQGYVVDATYKGFEIDLNTNKFIINIDSKLTLTKADETKDYEGFNLIYTSRFYDIASIAQEIVSQEARFCNFEYLGYMIFYPEFKIDKFRTSDSVLIYTVEHKLTKEKFRFAVRGCVIPPGL